MSDLPWPDWATAPISILSRDEARNHLKSAQGFWRDFALAGLTVADMRLVIEDRRRLGPGGKIAVPGAKVVNRPKAALAQPDNTIFSSFPPLDPDDDRWMHA